MSIKVQVGQNVYDFQKQVEPPEGYDPDLYVAFISKPIPALFRESELVLFPREQLRSITMPAPPEKDKLAEIQEICEDYLDYDTPVSVLHRILAVIQRGS